MNTTALAFPRRLAQAAALALALGLTLGLGGCASTPDPALSELLSHDGLQRVDIRGIDLAYARPGVTLAGFKKVMVDPVDVSFSPSWDPRRAGTSFRLGATERENIRSGVANIVRDELVAALQAGGAYPVVSEAGPDVLRVSASIINLFVSAPDTMSPGRSRVYIASAGEMTLVAELRDAESGQVIARLVDRRQARGTGQLTLTNSVVNAREAQSIAAAWARILRTNLDNAQVIGR